MAPLTGKHVLVIGGSSGLGFGAARASLAEGAIVTIASSSSSKVRAAAERLGGGAKVRTEVVNVAEESSVKELFERVGSVDHLVFSVSSPMRGVDDLLNAPLGWRSCFGHGYLKGGPCAAQDLLGCSLLGYASTDIHETHHKC